MYVDLAGLARYKRDFDAWARGALLPKDAAAARVRTAKAGAVSFVPVQETPLDVSVDFLFTETPPASGDKGPDNPSTISGVSSVSIRQLGVNLAFSASIYRFSSLGDGFYGATIDNTTGSVNLSGRVLYLSAQNLSFLDRDKSYCCVIEYQNCDQFSLGNTVGNPLFTTENEVQSLSGTGIQKINLVVRNVANPTYALRVATDVPIGASRTFKFRVAILQCTAAEVDLSTYQYDSANNLYTLPLGSTYYGGTLDVATGVMTVTWEKLAVTGGEAWQSFGEQAAGIYSYALVRNFNSDGGATGNGDTCSNFIYNNGASEKIVSWHHSKKYIYVYSSISSLSDFKAWLASQAAAGTPVDFCFQSNEATIVQLSPPPILSLAQKDEYTPRVNTVYSDQQAVQVGYLKHPSAASADLRNAIVSLGGGV